MTTCVKICGLKTPDAVEAAIDGGADMVGFVFFPPSPRALHIHEAAALCAPVPKGITKVGLFVNPEDALLADVLANVPLDLIQLHGKETPARVLDVSTRFAKPVMKALAIATADDVATARAFEPVVDRLLFDAKPPKGATRPGGNALAFDWGLLDGATWSVPWLLAGGLTPDNVAAALRLTRAPGVDVSSGVEDAPGIKSTAKIRAFLAAAQSI